MEPVGTVAAFKSAYAITKGLVKFSATKEFKDEIIKLQDAIFSANERYSTLLEENNDLKNKISKLETWDRKKKRYELKAIRDGVFVYAFKESEQKGEPPHYICPHCYEEEKISILRKIQDSTGRIAYNCHKCDYHPMEASGGPRRIMR